MIRQMYKDIKNEKQKIIRRKKIKRTLKFTTLIATGIGVTSIGGIMLYNKSRNLKENECDCGCDYDEDGCYCQCDEDDINEECNCNCDQDSNTVNQCDCEQENLESKIEEFNSNRLTYDNEHKDLENK